MNSLIHAAILLSLLYARHRAQTQECTPQTRSRCVRREVRSVEQGEATGGGPVEAMSLSLKNITIYATSDLGGVIKLRDLRWRDYPGLSRDLRRTHVSCSEGQRAFSSRRGGRSE